MGYTIALAVFCLVSAIQLAPADPLTPLKSVNCPSPYQDVGGYCLYFHTLEEGSWYDVKILCSEFKGHLVKVDDANLLYDIVKFIEEEHMPHDNFWLGGTDESYEGDWRWEDNTKVKMGTPFWGTRGKGDYPEIQEPNGGTNENCVAIDRGYLFFFHDYPCDSQFSGICQYDL